MIRFNLAGKFHEDSFNFRFFLQHEFLDLIVDVHKAHGLNKKCGS